jgi:hypothetical protein
MSATDDARISGRIRDRYAPSVCGYGLDAVMAERANAGIGGGSGRSRSRCWLPRLGVGRSHRGRGARHGRVRPGDRLPPADFKHSSERWSAFRPTIRLR